MHLLARECPCVCVYVYVTLCVRACLCEHVVKTERKKNVNVTRKYTANRLHFHNVVQPIGCDVDGDSDSDGSSFSLWTLGAFLPFIVSRAREKKNKRNDKPRHMPK